MVAAKTPSVPWEKTFPRPRRESKRFALALGQIEAFHGKRFLTQNPKNCRVCSETIDILLEALSGSAAAQVTAFTCCVRGMAAVKSSTPAEA
jgi:hypothetical protein